MTQTAISRGFDLHIDLSPAVNDAENVSSAASPLF